MKWPLGIKELSRLKPEEIAYEWQVWRYSDFSTTEKWAKDILAEGTAETMPAAELAIVLTTAAKSDRYGRWWLEDGTQVNVTVNVMKADELDISINSR